MQILLGRAQARTDALTLMGWKLAAEIDTLSPADASAIKVYGSELAVEVYRALKEIVGPAAGIAADSAGAVLAGRLERYFRSSLVMTFGGGTNEIQRDIIGYVGLGMPAAKRLRDTTWTSHFLPRPKRQQHSPRRSSRTTPRPNAWSRSRPAATGSTRCSGRRSAMPGCSR